LNFLKAKNQRTTFSLIQKTIERGTGRSFTLARFQQILYAAPELYIHHWDLRHKTPELIIEVPKNIAAILENPQGTPASSEPYDGKFTTPLLNQRASFFDQALRRCAVDHYNEVRHVTL